MTTIPGTGSARTATGDAYLIGHSALGRDIYRVLLSAAPDACLIDSLPERSSVVPNKRS